jgi:gliding motility-associated lipoprotein GldH
MRSLIVLILAAITFVACDDSRVYEKNYDFDGAAWAAPDKPEFEFEIQDTTEVYNIYCNVRNSLTYPFSRLFVTYYLQDSIGKILKKDLVSQTLFDPKTGDPQGSSGLGDIYDRRVLLLSGHRFPYAGRHKISFEQFMRMDTLTGVLAVGVRVEKVLPD